MILGWPLTFSIWCQKTRREKIAVTVCPIASTRSITRRSLQFLSGRDAHGFKIEGGIRCLTKKIWKRGPWKMAKGYTIIVFYYFVSKLFYKNFPGGSVLFPPYPLTLSCVHLCFQGLRHHQPWRQSVLQFRRQIISGAENLGQTSERWVRRTPRLVLWNTC